MNNIPTSMRCIEIKEPGGPEVLSLTERRVPEVGINEVLIRVHAAGVNRPDCLQRQGLYVVPEDASPLPGLEVSGDIVYVGNNARKWKAGDRVVALTHGGGYAQFCVANENHCLPWPQSMSAEEAASLPETFFTVHHNLLERAKLRSHETLLVHGGSSGIGTTAIQVARTVGASVIVTAGTDAKCDYCISLGAELAINYRDSDFEEVVSKHYPDGIDVVLDMVAGGYVNKNLKLLRADGRYAMIAFLGGMKAEVNFAQILPKRLQLMGSTLRPQSVQQKAAIASRVEKDLWPKIGEGLITTRIEKIFPFSKAQQAHELMESSSHMGKIVLKVC